MLIDRASAKTALYRPAHSALPIIGKRASSLIAQVMFFGLSSACVGLPIAPHSAR